MELVSSEEKNEVDLEKNETSGSKFDTSIRRKIYSTVASLIPYRTTVNDKREIDQAVDKLSGFPDVFVLLGFHEIYLPSLYRAVLIEFVGTATFIFMHIAIILACRSYTYPPLQIGIGHFFLLTIYIYQFAMSSGAHFNSMITMAAISTRHIHFLRGLLFIGAQIFGATVGAEVMRKSISEETARSVALGSCNKGSLETDQALTIEFFFSINLLYVVYGTAFNLRQREIYGPIVPPILIGITLGLVIFASASLAPPPFTGAGSNPSLCLGTAWSYSAIVGTEEAMDSQWIYWIGPIMACVANALLYAVSPPHHDSPANKEN